MQLNVCCFLSYNYWHLNIFYWVNGCGCGPKAAYCPLIACYSMYFLSIGWAEGGPLPPSHFAPSNCPIQCDLQIGQSDVYFSFHFNIFFLLSTYVPRKQSFPLFFWKLCKFIEQIKLFLGQSVEGVLYRSVNV